MIPNIISKAMLVGKITGQKVNSPVKMTKDICKFINKRGELNTFTVIKDEFGRPLKKELLSNKTGASSVRDYSYCTYTYEGGVRVTYKVIKTSKYEPPKVPMQKANLTLQEREIIATVQNGDKLDVTKSKTSFWEPFNGSNIYERSFVARFSNKKKPQGIMCQLERTPQMDIASKETTVQKANGKVSKIIPDLFYNTPAYTEPMFMKEVVKMLRKEMGLSDVPIDIKLAHRGYSNAPGAVNNRGSFNNKTKKYIFNIDHPEMKTRKGFAGNAAHELLHAWQHREVELLERGLLTGARKDAATVYKKEFDNYIKSSKTDPAQQEAYVNQIVETTAREMQKFVKQYYTRNMKNIYNNYVKGIIPPQIGITTPIPTGELKNL